MTILEALKGNQGVHETFLVYMDWREIEKLVVEAGEFQDYEGLDEDERMQRSISRSRIREIAEYFATNKDRFINSLVYVLMPPDLAQAAKPFNPDDPDAHYDYDFHSTDPSPGIRRPKYGILYLPPGTRMVPADGNHRTAGGLQALENGADIKGDDVPVIIVPFHSIPRVKQQFADLNLNPKTVSKTVGYRMESRDESVVAAKWIADKIGIFRGRVNKRSNSLPHTSTNVITLSTLVAGTKELAEGLTTVLRTEVGIKVDAETVAMKHRDKLLRAWTVIVELFDPYWRAVDAETNWRPIYNVLPEIVSRDLKMADDEGNLLMDATVHPGDLRSLLVFPLNLGWLGLCMAARRLMKEHGADWDKVLRENVDSIDWSREGNMDWRGMILDAAGEKISNTNTTRSALASYIVDPEAYRKAQGIRQNGTSAPV